MKKIFNLILSLLTIGLLVLFIYSKIDYDKAIELGKWVPFALEYGALILLGGFACNNLIAKALSLIVVVIIIILAIILFVAVKDPNFIANLIGL